ncbi:MAG: histidinol-phosphate transaminase [Flavobacterium sp.]|jgi:histidinol-phosphate aminotransferase|uniref:histidinol-phosphate transaminase n=1 Tax=Flavobacterium sp. TaxID=239 RepID=UPI0022C1570D|nr:histidinol-phosphate transaminase [Flavobacterium sp.]MCZ8295903.1 histidinol-phosphate transaminase [Flavobacterium sp.]
MNPLALIRPNIAQLIPYSSAREEYTGTTGIFLDANEFPEGKYNRYPDPEAKAVQSVLAAQIGCAANQLILGNGSDEIIDLVQRAFGIPETDSIIVCPPTYGMYEVFANINNLECIRIPLTGDFQLDIPQILAQKAKILYLCSPNNPTGNELENIEILLQNFQGIVFLDEAYIDFSPSNSKIELLQNYPNLIIAQTLSKAKGLAGLRMGMGIAHPEIIAVLKKIKPPYNISQANQELALQALQNWDATAIETLVKERDKLVEGLKNNPSVRRIFPSVTNFILVEMTEADRIYAFLTGRNLIVRNRSKDVPNTLRITVGTPQENELLLKTLAEFQ